MYAEPNYAVRRNNPNILSLFGVQTQIPFNKGLEIKEDLKPDLTLNDPKKELNEEDQESEDKKDPLDKGCGDGQKKILDEPEMFVPGANKK